MPPETTASAAHGGVRTAGRRLMSAPFGSLRMTRLSCFAPRDDPPRAGRSSGDCRSSASLSFQPTSEAEIRPALANRSHPRRANEAVWLIDHINRGPRRRCNVTSRANWKGKPVEEYNRIESYVGGVAHALHPAAQHYTP